MGKEFPIDSEGFHPFGDLIGLKFEKVEEGYSKCSLEVKDRLLNPHDVLHGGILYSMADTGMGAALYPSLSEDESCATVEVKITYFEVVSSGVITCETKVVNKGKNLANFESEIRKKDKELVAKATGTFYVSK